MAAHRKHLLSISLLLGIGTLAAFWPVTRCQFVNFDDPRYLDLPQVRGGLSLAGIRWALTATHASNWHPLTWMSLMLDRSLYGSNPTGYHLTSLLFHIGSVILLFLLLARITGSPWRSGFVAALFGIHPLHVESVAWIAERKDVLSTFLMMLTLWGYVLYTERPTVKRRVSAIGLFALGLMAKPMLVTLPFVLLLLDYWPLERFKARKQNQPPPWGELVWEKLPFFILAGASCVITYLVQHKGGAVLSLQRVPVWARFENALLSYVGYVWKTVWPAKLAFFYPYPTHLPQVWKALASGVVLAAITILVVLKARRHPCLTVGWLWYVGTLVPVIGLVQVGDQAMADRYTYIPLIGLFIMVAWLIPDFVVNAKRWGEGAMGRWGEKTLAVAAGMILLSLGMVTWRQAGTWHDSISLSRHAIAVTKDNYQAYCMLGVALTDEGKTREAVEQFSRAVQIKPESGYAHTGLANALANEKRFDLAIPEYEEAIRLQPGYPVPHYNLGMIFAAQGKLDQAIEQLSKVAEINRGPTAQPEMFPVTGRRPSAMPSDAKGHYELAMALAREGRLDEAIAHLQQAIELAKPQPQDAEAHFYRGNELSSAGNRQQAILEYREAIRLKPDLAAAHNNLAVALYMTGDYAGAWKEAHLCRKYGLQPPADFLKALAEKQPDH